MAENGWLREQLSGVQGTLADCQGAAYPLEVLWALVAFSAFSLVMGLGRLWWMRNHPQDTYPWDM